METGTGVGNDEAFVAWGGMCRAVLVCCVCLLACGLASCAVNGAAGPGRKPKARPVPGPVSVQLGARMGRPFEIASKVPWNDTGIQVVKGRCYEVVVQPCDAEPYTDGGVPADAAGVKGFFGRLFDCVARDATGPSLLARCVARAAERRLHEGKIHRLRVLKDAQRRKAHFMTLMAAVGHDDQEANTGVIGTGGFFTPARSGELTLFANDWPGGRGSDPRGDERFVDSATYANNTGSLRITVRPAVCGAPAPAR